MLLGVKYHESSDKERKKLLRELNDGFILVLPPKKERDRLADELREGDEIKACCGANTQSLTGTLFLISDRILILDHSNKKRDLTISLKSVVGIGIQGTKLVIEESNESHHFTIGARLICYHVFQKIDESLTAEYRNLCDTKFRVFSRRQTRRQEKVSALRGQVGEHKEQDDRNFKRIEKRLSEIGKSKIFGVNKELKHLSRIIEENEEILTLVDGFSDRKTCIVVCTDKRILWLDKGLLFSVDVKEANLDDISAISYQHGIMFAEITISIGTKEIKIDKVSQVEVIDFVKTVNSARNRRRERNWNESGLGEPRKNDVIAKLSELSQLREKGVVSEEEYSKLKSSLLERV